MTLEEYKQYIPNLEADNDDLTVFLFFMNEFIKNSLGSCEQEELEQYLTKEPFKDTEITEELAFNLTAKDGKLCEDVTCYTVKDIVLHFYRVYKRTIDNSVIQGSVSDEKVMAIYEQDKKRAEFISGLINKD